MTYKAQNNFNPLFIILIVFYTAAFGLFGFIPAQAQPSNIASLIMPFKIQAATAKPVASSIIILDGKEKKIALKSPTSQFLRTFQIEIPEGKKITNLRAGVTQFKSPEIKDVVPNYIKWKLSSKLDCKPSAGISTEKEFEEANKEICLIENEHVELLVNVDFPILGEYKSLIQLKYKVEDNTGKPSPYKIQQIQLKITREKKKLNVKFLNVDRVQHNPVYFPNKIILGLTNFDILQDSLNIFSKDVTLGVTGEETNGLTTKVSPQIYGWKIKFNDEDKGISPEEEIKPLFFTNDKKSIDKKNHLKIDGSSVFKFKIHLPQITEPGEYNATLHLSAKDKESKTHPIQFSVKKGGDLALFLISIGVLIGWHFLTWDTTKRSRLIWQREMAKLIERLNNIKSKQTHPNEVGLVINFHQAIKKLFHDLDIDEIENLDDRLERVRKKIPLLKEWFEINRLIQRIRDEGFKSFILKKLNNIAEGFPDESITDSDIEPNLKDVKEKITKHIVEQFVFLKNEIENYLITFDQSKEKLSLISNITFDELKLDDDKSFSSDNTNKAIIKFQDALFNYYQILGNDLEKKISNIPQEITIDSLKEMNQIVKEHINKIKTAENIKDARHFYSDSYLTYSNYLSEGILNFAQTVIKKSDNDSQIELLNEIIKDINEIPNQTDIPFPWLNIYELEIQLKKVKDSQVIKQNPKGDQDNLDAAITLRQTIKLPKPPQSDPLEINNNSIISSKETELDKFDLPSQTSIDIKIMKGDQAAKFTVAILAVASGFNYLWLENPIWGTYSDMILAVFWGFGLQKTKDVASIFSTLGKRFTPSV